MVPLRHFFLVWSLRTIVKLMIFCDKLLRCSPLWKIVYLCYCIRSQSNILNVILCTLYSICFLSWWRQVGGDREHWSCVSDWHQSASETQLCQSGNSTTVAWRCETFWGRWWTSSSCTVWQRFAFCSNAEQLLKFVQ